MTMPKTLLYGATALAASLLGGTSAGAASAELRAGAARIEITPRGDALEGPFKRINDEVYVRAVVIDSQGSRAVLVIADVPMIQQGISAELSQQIAELAGVPAANVLLGVTHTHNTMRVDPDPGGLILPGSARFTRTVGAATLAAVREAIARLRPARMGLGAGRAYLVGAKNSFSKAENRWVEAVDRSGADNVNRALGIARFEGLDGKPIAFLLNYAINPVVAMAMKDAISGDVPGAATRHVERRAGNGAVALFTVGASGNPLYRADPDGYAEPADPDALMQAMGTILGEEALAAARDAPASDAAFAITAQSTILTCLGKVTVPLNLPDRCSNDPAATVPRCDFKDRETGPVRLRLGVIQLGPLTVVHSDSDVSAPVGMRLQAASPAPETWIATTNYGPMKYVVRDADYALNTYEATATTAQKGCAEQGYVAAALAMIRSPAENRTGP